MFDWITKPYIKWNFIDSIIASVGFLIFFIVISLIINAILFIINKRRDKKSKRKDSEK